MKDIIQYFKEKKVINDIWLLNVFENVNGYHDINNYTTYGLPKYNIWQNYLYERLGDSLQIDNKFLTYLCKNIQGLEKIEIISDYRLSIKYNDKFSTKDKLFITFCNFFNYYIMDIDENNNNLELEARKPNECTEKSLPFVYHITSKDKYEKILKHGLVPKFQSKLFRSNNYNFDYDNPTHIYVFQNTIDKINLQMYAYLLGYKNNDWVLLKIDTQKFKDKHNGTPLKFFGDPSTVGFPAMFTEEPISSIYIEKIEH